MRETIEAVRTFLIEEIVPDVDPAEIEDETPLFDVGILDSLSVLRLRAFLEDRFAIRLGARDLGFEWMGSLRSIAELVEARR